MYLTELQCEGFRGLSNVVFEPAEGVNLLCGDNAQGKTSVLEAILFLVTARSHRTNVETDLVEDGGEGFRLSARVCGRDGPMALEAHWWQGVKRFRINGVLQQRISDILGKASVVLASQEDAALVRGSAAFRRKFMDMELSQLQPAYLAALQQYRQVLRQRNELLRTQGTDHALLEAWEVQLSKHGSVLIKERRTFIEELGRIAARAYARISDGEELEITYRPDVSEHDVFLTALARSRDSDLRRGMTTHGPHRDDMALSVAGRAARSFGSQGQQKTIAVSMKLALFELVKGRTGEYPILMLDEVFAELDAVRSRQLFDAIDDGVQCLLTTTDLSGGLPASNRACTRFLMRGGHLEKG